MASFNNSKYSGGASFDNLLLQSLMGRLQIRPPSLSTDSLLSQSLDDLLFRDDLFQAEDGAEGAPFGGGGPDQTPLAREEAKLEKEIIRIVRSGSATETLKPNSGQSVAIGDHNVCVGYHEEPGSEYRIWEWHGHIMLFDEENGFSPEYIYGNHFERIPLSSATKEGQSAEGEDETKNEEGGNSGLRDLIEEEKDSSARRGGGRVIHRNFLNTAGLAK